jgi:hypothetical protein
MRKVEHAGPQLPTSPPVGVAPAGPPAARPGESGYDAARSGAVTGERTAWGRHLETPLRQFLAATRHAGTAPGVLSTTQQFSGTHGIAALGTMPSARHFAWLCAGSGKHHSIEARCPHAGLVHGREKVALAHFP